MVDSIDAIFEATCRPIIEEIAERVRQRFPAFKIVVGSSSIPLVHGHLLSADALRDMVHADEPNCVSLCIGLNDLDSSPYLCTLEVCWGGDGIPPCDGIDCIDAAIPWGTDAVRKVKAEAPTLEASFIHCLARWEHAYGSKND